MPLLEPGTDQMAINRNTLARYRLAEIEAQAKFQQAADQVS